MSRVARADGPRDGYILVAVLGVMLLLTAFMAGGSVLVRSALNSVKVGDDDVAIAGLTQGGLELTAYQLFVLKLPAPLVDGRRIKFAGGTIKPVITDEAGKIDLNASDPLLLKAAFQSTGLDAGTAAGIVARIETIRGADRNRAAQPQPQFGTAPAPAAATRQQRGFQSLDELAMFPDLTRDDRRVLAGLLTVYNPDGKVDIISASPRVLGLLPGLTKPAQAIILAHREGTTQAQALALMTQVGDAQKYAKSTSGPAYTVRIEAAAASGRTKQIEAVIAASKSLNDPYYVLDWRT